MKKLLSVTLCVVILMMPMFTASSFAAGKSFVALGDSIAEGMGSTDVNKDSYVALVAAANGYELHNISRGGATSFTLRDKVLNDEYAREFITDADIIVISIGGNDFLLNELVLTVATALIGDFTRLDAALAAFQDNFSVTVAEIRELNPTALVIVQTLYNPLEIVPAIGRTYEKALTKFNGFFYDYLAENPGAYVITDIHGAFAGKSGLIARDTIHPSVKGHALIAETMLATIAAYEAGEIGIQTAPASQPRTFIWNIIVRIIALLKLS